jgi:hypothetical protein
VNVIDANGQYAFVPGTRTLAQSDHPVHRARIEIALPAGAWLYAPAAGHNLARFARKKQGPATLDEFRKELLLYLKDYAPDVAQILVDRDATEFDLLIAEEAASNGV